MKKLLLVASALLISGTIFSQAQNNHRNSDPAPRKQTVKRASLKAAAPKIQIALLLDTSSSMDGLIDQAKARLWNIVNTMTTLKYHGHEPRIEIALYEYGNSYLSEGSGFIRQLTPLTADLDLISEYLFSLITYGGYEYCGQVIDKAVNDLQWSDGDSDMKLIYIAGNEPFTQGEISYKNAIDNALNNNIYVHTIHCGSENAGILGMWQDGAIRGQGKFFNIDHNRRIVHIDTPYDASIAECNTRLNQTYVAYGSRGVERMAVQAKQDMNAMAVSSANMAERSVSKATSAYKNSSWDMVDLLSEDESVLEDLKDSELPEEFRGKTAEEIKAELKKKQEQRETLQKEIRELATKRQSYIDKNSNTPDDDDLGKAITESIMELASKKGYSAS